MVCFLSLFGMEPGLCSYLTVSNDKMKMKCKRNCALWVAGGSMAGGGFLHGFLLYLNVA